LDLEKNASRIIHTAIFTDINKKFSLGWGHESDLRINDISVSRLHASLQYKNDQFVMLDCRSKFGTLALHHGDLNLEIGMTQTLQIGRTVITVLLKANTPWT
jgi:predicted component of type VI protein secretion system